MRLYLPEIVRAVEPLVREESIELKGVEKEVPQLVRLDPVRVRVEASEESGVCSRACRAADPCHLYLFPLFISL